MRAFLILCCFLLCSANPALSAPPKAATLSPWGAAISQHLITLIFDRHGAEIVRNVGVSWQLGREGAEAKFRIRVQPDGKILAVDIVRPSGFPYLDRMIQRVILGAHSVPPAPRGITKPDTFILPVKYSRR
jgi:TonB family protein